MQSQPEYFIDMISVSEQVLPSQNEMVNPKPVMQSGIQQQDRKLVMQPLRQPVSQQVRQPVTVGHQQNLYYEHTDRYPQCPSCQGRQAPIVSDRGDGRSLLVLFILLLFCFPLAFCFCCKLFNNNNNFEYICPNCRNVMRTTP